MAKPYLCLWLIGTALVSQALPGEGAIIAKVAQSGESIELEGQSEGRRISSSLTLYTSGAVRYFSAGVGLEERSAQYPPFPSSSSSRPAARRFSPTWRSRFGRQKAER